MSLIFYDMETTGTNAAFDQILQFAAIRTDSALNEIERFEVRCRLLPHVIPAPGALRVNGATVSMLTDAALPTHYEMIRAIRHKLLSWSPAVFMGWNSSRFDENLLRQAFYQTLHPPYLTNTAGNNRSDAMRLTKAASIFAPGTLVIPRDDAGRQVFKLEAVAQSNGFGHPNAHDAMADAEAALQLSRLVYERAPDIWSAFMRFSQKAAVIDYLEDETVISLSDVYSGRPYSWLVTALCANSVNKSEHVVYNLAVDPALLADMGEEALMARLGQNPRPLLSVKCNGAPIIMPAEDAPDIARTRAIGLDELARRAEALREDSRLRARLAAAFEATSPAYGPAEHVEQKIYEGFVSKPDENLMAAFHDAPWEERAGIVSRLKDERLIELGLRLIWIERPDCLEDAARRDIEMKLARRAASTDETAPWLTCERAMQSIDEMLAAEVNGAQKEFLEVLRLFLAGRLEQARTLLA
jgi:exodeoxyribonuclease-1